MVKTFKPALTGREGQQAEVAITLEPNGNGGRTMLPRCVVVTNNPPGREQAPNPTGFTCGTW